VRQHIVGILAGAVVIAMAPTTASAVSPTAPQTADPTGVEVSDLTVNDLPEPLGIGLDDPDLSWQLNSQRRGVMQQAYEVHVASSAEALADPDVWDSGRVQSDRSVDVPYEGPRLEPRTDYVWSVRVWDDRGVASEWSEPALFGTALGD
jgi:alpha-L-rhamnosidase